MRCHTFIAPFVSNTHGFANIIKCFWQELGERVGEGGSIDYWDWIGADTYEETINRAYLTVFVVGDGYAKVKWDRLLEETLIVHNKELNPDSDVSQISLPVLVDYKEWEQWHQK